MKKVSDKEFEFSPSPKHDDKFWLPSPNWN